MGLLWRSGHPHGGGDSVLLHRECCPRKFALSPGSSQASPQAPGTGSSVSRLAESGHQSVAVLVVVP